MKTLGLCLASSLLLTTPSYAQSASDVSARLGFYVNATQSFIDGFKSIICPQLSGEEQRICEQVRVRVAREWGFGAFASRDGITLSAGVGYVFDTISWAMIASNETFGDDACFRDYMGYFINLVMQNSVRASSGQQLRAAVPVTVFAEDENACSGLTVQDMTALPPEVLANHAKYVDASLMFILLHELGHIVLQHPELDARQLSLLERRKAEGDADEWVFRSAQKLDYMLAGSMAPFFIGSINGDTLDWEKNSDHPLGVRRLANFYSAMLSDLEENPQRRAALGENYEGVLEDARVTRDKAIACLEDIEAGHLKCDP